MKKILKTLLICNAASFLALIAYAGIAPAQFSRNMHLLELFRLFGAGVFVTVIYFVYRIFLAGMHSASKPNR